MVSGEHLSRTANERAERARLAERVGFEPTCRLPDKTLSRRPRYDLFGPSPLRRCAIVQNTHYNGLGRTVASPDRKSPVELPPPAPQAIHASEGFLM